jgi:hypothetical protein
MVFDQSRDSHLMPPENGDTKSTPSDTEKNDDQSFPDGGWRAWSVVLGSWCLMVPSFGLLNTIGVFQTWLAEHQLKEYPISSIAWIFSLYAFFIYFGSVQIGECPDIPYFMIISIFFSFIHSDNQRTYI